ncbi:MAG: hypothetical protein OXE17_00085 [Chloroflexi bacterium]|nr:hypothetical protein [Chloroflexota bacterium]
MNTTQDRFLSFPWKDSRVAFIDLLVEAQEILHTNLGEVNLDRPVLDYPEEATDGEILAATFQLWSLVPRKIGFHIASAILANAHNNIHSLGVHTKVLMECAAEMMSIARNAVEKTPEAFRYITNNLEYDTVYWMRRLSKGGISQEELTASLARAREGTGPSDGKQPTKVRLVDRVSVLTQGRIWYPYLNDSFCHTKPDRLRVMPGMGGILPAPELQFDIAFVFVLNIALHYTCQALTSYGAIKILPGGGSQLFDDAIALSEKVRQMAAPFRELQNEVSGEKMTNPEEGDSHE